MKHADCNRIVAGLMAELDAHAPGERRHAERVSVFAVATAHRLGVRHGQLRSIRYAAQLHDMGKIRLNAELLSKAGRLDEIEMRVLRKHAELAIEVLAEHPFLAPCVPIIRHHHEKWDGTGYPQGLCEQAIPLGSRIISLCEAFDVMAYGSAWQSPIGEEGARDRVERQSGLAFDPEVVEAFLQIQSLVQPIES